MARYLTLENGVVTNSIEADEDYAAKIGAVLSDQADVGWTYDGVNFRPPAPKPLSIAQYTAAVQTHLDSKANERNYDGILSACTYAGSPSPKFAAEGHACVIWRDQVWATCYQVLGEVGAGQRPAPTLEELLSLLPVMVWPEVQQ